MIQTGHRDQATRVVRCLNLPAPMTPDSIATIVTRRQGPSHERAPRLGAGVRVSSPPVRSPRIVSTVSGDGTPCVRAVLPEGNSKPSIAPAVVPAWKRCLDVLCVGISLPFCLPLMALAGLWVKLVSRGPVLVRQPRIGRNGKPFVLYKLRSMKVHAGPDRHAAYFRGLVEADRPMLKLDIFDAPRLIPGGRLMRAAGLDELPQLFNVLRGEMSLVGPRPCLPEEYGCFTLEQRERFAALPGITGLWQVTGKDKATFREMNVMDIHYLHHASLMLDLRIMLRTPDALLRQMIPVFQQKAMARRKLSVREAGAHIGHGTPTPRHPHLL